MTEAQRNYLADLAAKKGAILENTDDVSVAWASAKIEELKMLPDAIFDDISEAEVALINKYTDQVLKGLSLWSFQR